MFLSRYAEGMYLYAFHNRMTSLVKIGVSQNPEQRRLDTEWFDLPEDEHHRLIERMNREAGKKPDQEALPSTVDPNAWLREILLEAMVSGGWTEGELKRKAHVPLKTVQGYLRGGKKLLPVTLARMLRAMDVRLEAVTEMRQALPSPGREA